MIQQTLRDPLFVDKNDGQTAVIGRRGNEHAIAPWQMPVQQPGYQPPPSYGPPAYGTYSPSPMQRRPHFRRRPPSHIGPFVRKPALFGDTMNDSITIPSAQSVMQTVGLVLSLAVLGVGLVTVVKAAHKGR